MVSQPLKSSRAEEQHTTGSGQNDPNDHLVFFCHVAAAYADGDITAVTRVDVFSFPPVMAVIALPSSVPPPCQEGIDSPRLIGFNHAPLYALESSPFTFQGVRRDHNTWFLTFSVTDNLTREARQIIPQSHSLIDFHITGGVAPCWSVDRMQIWLTWKVWLVHKRQNKNPCMRIN